MDTGPVFPDISTFVIPLLTYTDHNDKCTYPHTVYVLIWTSSQSVFTPPKFNLINLPQKEAKTNIIDLPQQTYYVEHEIIRATTIYVRRTHLFSH